MQTDTKSDQDRVETITRQLEAIIATKDTQQLLTEKNAQLLAELKALSTLGFERVLANIKSTFGKIFGLRTFVAQLMRGEEEPVKDVADIAKDWAAEYGDIWSYDVNMQCWRKWNGKFHEKVEERGSELDQYAVDALQSAGKAVDSSNMLNTFQRLAQSYCKRVYVPVEGKVNFSNGTLDIGAMQLLYHYKDDNLTYCLPYDFEPGKPHPRITAFLESTILQRHVDPQTNTQTFVPNPHGVQAIVAHLGLALIGDVSLQKSGACLGAPGAGKSTLLDLFNITCGIPPANYVPHDVFSRELEGKRSRYIYGQRRVACMDEIPPDALREEEIFKSMSSHKGVAMRGNYKDDQEDNQWKPKILMVGNNDPQYKDISGAVKRRLFIVRMPIQRYDEPRPGQPAQDAKLLGDFLSELGGFAATCIACALEVRARSYYPQSAVMKRDLDEMTTGGNPLKACLEDKFVLDPTAHTSTFELHTIYENYCFALGESIKPLAALSFSRELCGMNIGVTAKKKGGKRALLGIRPRGEDDPQPPEDDDPNKHEDSLLLESWTDAGRMRTDGFSSVHANGRALQAVVDTHWTDRTDTLEKSILNEDISSGNGNGNTHVLYRKIKTDDHPSYPSTVDVDVPIEQAHEVDRCENIRPKCENIRPFSSSQGGMWPDKVQSADLGLCTKCHFNQAESIRVTGNYCRSCWQEELSR